MPPCNQATFSSIGFVIIGLFRSRIQLQRKLGFVQNSLSPKICFPCVALLIDSHAKKVYPGLIGVRVSCFVATSRLLEHLWCAARSWCSAAAAALTELSWTDHNQTWKTNCTHHPLLGLGTFLGCMSNPFLWRSSFAAWTLEKPWSLDRISREEQLTDATVQNCVGRGPCICVTGHLCAGAMNHTVCTSFSITCEDWGTDFGIGYRVSPVHRPVMANKRHRTCPAFLLILRMLVKAGDQSSLIRAFLIGHPGRTMEMHRKALASLKEFGSLQSLDTEMRKVAAVERESSFLFMQWNWQANSTPVCLRQLQHVRKLQNPNCGFLFHSAE